MRVRLQTLAHVDDALLFLDTDGISGRHALHDPDPEPTWRRTTDAEAVRFEDAPDPEYQSLARYVLAQAVADARLTSPSMALLARRARRWLRRPSPDLTFWCQRAGITVTNLTVWATAHFPKAEDPRPTAPWIRAVVKQRKAPTFAAVRPDLEPLKTPLTHRRRGRPRKIQTLVGCTVQ